MRSNTVRAQLKTTLAVLVIAAAVAAPLAVAAPEAPETVPSAGGTPAGGTPAGGGTPEGGTPDITPTPPEAGLVIYVDPLTGELTGEPTHEQIEALSESLKTALSRSTDGLETFELVGGGHGVQLGGRFRTATVARRNGDGTWRLTCVDHPEEAAAAIDSPTPDPVWEEK